MKISTLTKPELDRFREQCNFTDTERKCFDLKAKDFTNTQLSLELNISESMISVHMKRVRAKMFKVLEWEV